MNKDILNIEIQGFINDNLNSDINDILLKGTHFASVSTSEIIEQIEAKKRCQKKLPTWFKTQHIYFPNKLNIEQTSSEITAKYKSELIDGHSLIDITGGFGVDCFYFSKRFKTIVHCEISEHLSNIVKHNYQQFKIENVKTLNVDGLKFLSDKTEPFDWVYIDPSRRHDSKGKVFFLKDCLPDVPENIEMLFKCSNNVMIKTSPLLDISAGINELQYVKTIHIIAVNNEVKELLWILENNFKGGTNIETVNIKTDKNENFSFNLEDEKQTEADYSPPLSYLYEPNSAILKSGAFNQVAKQCSVLKLHHHSHLYTSEHLSEFPGRCFKIIENIPYNKRELKCLGINKANITTRNFTESVGALRKKFSIKDGGDVYMFFTTDINNSKIVLITEKAMP